MEPADRPTLFDAEGIDLDRRLAGLGRRGGAVLVDLVLQGLALVVVAVAGAFDAGGAAMFAVVTLLILLGYPVLCEALAGGRTAGKALLGIAVVSADGSPVTFGAAIVRNVVRVVDAFPGTYFVGLASALVTPRRQRVGDLAAGTIVVRRRVGSPGGTAVGGGVPGDALAPEASGWDVSAVTADEVATVRSFLDRRDQLDQGNRADLAQTLAFQLLPKVTGVPLEGGPEAFLERVVASEPTG